MSLAPGTLIESCEVLGLLGKGGMGEVYRARDKKLGREVAIKALPTIFTQDSERLARFQREAHLLAALNHPNLAIIHELKEVEGAKYLVLELVEGETLAERIERGPLPAEEALAVAHQIAEGLSAAHEKGIVHRDLKPANIKITPEGRVKILDFGLAKTNDFGSGPPDVSNSPTLSALQTQGGVIMGTAAYMSPEQARGKNVDRRSDIWSFGAVFYEMLAGRNAFPNGETVSDTLAGILKGEVDMKALPKDTPPRVAALIERCLRKDVRRRLPDIAAARIEIEEIQNEPLHPAADPVPVSTPSRYLWPAIAAASLVIAAALAIWALRRPTQDDHVLRLEILVPTEAGLTSGQLLSPDGRKVAYIDTGAKRQIWVQKLDSSTAILLAGTEEAVRLAWSPDSRSLAFFAGGKIKRIASDGGPVREIAQVKGRDLAWGAGDVILFGGLGNPLSQVSALGGPIQQVTELSGMEATHDYPEFLPDGRRFSYFVRRGNSSEDWDVYFGSLDSKERHLIPDIHSAVKYSPAGYLLFNRNGGGTLVAQRFDLEQLKVIGEPFIVSEGTSGGVAGATFATSTNGSIAFIGSQNAGATTPTWVDRSGRQVKAAGAPGQYRNLALSINSAYIAFDRGGVRDVFVLDHSRGVVDQLTTDPAADAVPVWSPKSDAIAFLSSRDPAGSVAPNNVAGGNLYVAPFGVAGEERRLSTSTTGQRPADWSSDGRYLVYISEGDVWALDMAGDPKSRQITNTPFAESNARISPDGRWIAYNSLKSDTQEVVVRSFLTLGVERQVSINGGFLPRWNSNSREIFYLSPLPDSSVMAVALKEDGSGNLRLDPPVSLFPARLPSFPEYRSYDVAQDGRFLMNITTNEQTVVPITVIHNWAASVAK